MGELAALSLVFLLLVAVFWWQVRRLARYWITRDNAEALIPDRRHVHHTERITGVAKFR